MLWIFADLLRFTDAQCFTIATMSVAGVSCECLLYKNSNAVCFQGVLRRQFGQIHEDHERGRIEALTKVSPMCYQVRRCGSDAPGVE